MIHRTVGAEPCRGNSYAETFDVLGGKGPYRWTATEVPEGLSFDSNAHRVAGVALADGALGLQVLDETTGATGEARFVLTPRDTCWLAYIAADPSDDAGAGRLYFYDDGLQTEIQRPTAAIGAGSVSDFAFAPNGRHIAYRLDSSRLVLGHSPAWAEQVVDVPGPVSQYAWSPDSSVLAVAYSKDGSTYLGGLRISSSAPDASSVQSLSSADASAEGEPCSVEPLAPIAAPISSPIVWAGGTRAVAFDAVASDGGSREVHLAVLGSSGFETEFDTELGLFTEGLHLRGAAEGLFAIDDYHGQDPSVYFYQFGELVSTSDDVTYWDHRASFIAPSGRYTASTDTGQLSLDTSADDGVVAQTLGCDQLLSWALDKERIVCVTTTDAGGEARVFDFAAGTAPALTALGAIRGNDSVDGYSYAVGDAYERRRALSPSGRWFAFTTSDHLYVADLENGSPRLWRRHVSAPSSSIDLLFSPDESALLEQRGTDLYLYLLNRGTDIASRLNGGDPLAAATVCHEEFQAAPDAWCGNLRNATHFVWSPDSRYFAFASANGRLLVIDVSSAPSEFPQVWVNSTHACTSDCVSQFEFQPY